MSKETQNQDIKRFNKNFSKIIQHDINKDINDVYQDTKYSGI